MAPPDRARWAKKRGSNSSVVMAGLRGTAPGGGLPMPYFRRYFYSIHTLRPADWAASLDVQLLLMVKVRKLFSSCSEAVTRNQEPLDRRPLTPPCATACAASHSQRDASEHPAITNFGICLYATRLLEGCAHKAQQGQHGF